MFMGTAGREIVSIGDLILKRKESFIPDNKELSFICFLLLLAIPPLTTMFPLPAGY